MNEVDIRRELSVDLQRAPARRVIYLEGKSDVPIFFALLGVAPPRDGLHQGTFVRGLGSGRTSVRAHVDVAARSGAAYAGIRGVTDGDGEDLAALRPCFDAPFAGPCFRWPAYDIESMLTKTGWPSAWGVPPDWERVLIDHVPYAALNRLHRERFRNPVREEPLETLSRVAAALAADKHRIAGYDVEVRFLEEAAVLEAAIRRSLDEGHAVVKGKWLVDVFAPRTLGGSATPQRCRDEWIAHAVTNGGSPEVRDLWGRLTGRAP